MVEVLVVRATVGTGSARDAAQALLRHVLTRLTGTPEPEHRFVRRCASCGGPHGKPVLQHPSLHTSLSYVDGAVAVAVTSAGPVGVDVERWAATDFDGFDGVALAPGEQARTPAERARAWARKEAVLKAIGTGLAVDPATVDVRGDVVLGAHLVDVPTPQGIACAVAVLGAERPALSVEVVSA